MGVKKGTTIGVWTTGGIPQKFDHLSLFILLPISFMAFLGGALS
jgi:hypothetical protein